MTQSDELTKYEYYRDNAGVIYCGDCLEILPLLPDKNIDLVLTDPVWPNTINLFGVNNPQALLFSALEIVKHKVDRIVIHLGLDSDPRFLMAVPTYLPFVRSFALRYAWPYYKGRILYDRDIAYLFGNAPSTRIGNHLLASGCIDGDTVTSDNSGKLKGHPCARKYDHVHYLVDRCSNVGELVLDPFLGSGTTALAAKELGRKFIGIEIEKKYCAIAKERLSQEVMAL
jgi:DNA modification methylase